MSRKTRKVTYINHQDRLTCAGWRYLEERETQMGYVTNHRYYCPTCGEVWLSEMVELATGFSFYSRPCRKHSRSGFIGGVILASHWTGVDKYRLDGAPYDLLVHDFLLMLPKDTQ